ncbi:MAG TPA: hypothetical protein VLW54_09995 [Candidatus Acidoferrales bacterium]|nr:hypothetical protein [Candidatus Acidoferrales bacterium]
MSAPPQAEQSGQHGLRRILLTIVGGVGLTYCSYVAFFSLSRPYVLLEGAAAVVYAALFLAGVVLFFGGCVQAIGFLYRKYRGAQ